MSARTTGGPGVRRVVAGLMEGDMAWVKRKRKRKRRRRVG
jgi:hypothetical protein